MSCVPKEQRDKAAASNERARKRREEAELLHQSSVKVSPVLAASKPPSAASARVPVATNPVTLRPIWFCGFTALPDPNWRETLAKCVDEADGFGSGSGSFTRKPRIPVFHRLCAVSAFADGTLSVLILTAALAVFRPDDVWSWHNVALFWLKKPLSDVTARATASIVFRSESCLQSSLLSLQTRFVSQA